MGRKQRYSVHNICTSLSEEQAAWLFALARAESVPVAEAVRLCVERQRMASVSLEAHCYALLDQLLGKFPAFADMQTTEQQADWFARWLRAVEAVAAYQFGMARRRKALQPAPGPTTGAGEG